MGSPENKKPEFDTEVQNFKEELRDMIAKTDPEESQVFQAALIIIERLENVAMDELFGEAVTIVIKAQKGSVSLLQRRLGVDYGRALRMIKMMVMSGIVGEYKGQTREVMVTLKE